MTNLFWAFAIVWLLHMGYLLSLMARQNSLRREIQALKLLLEQKAQTPSTR
jgi:CcmD family protein